MTEQAAGYALATKFEKKADVSTVPSYHFAGDVEISIILYSLG